MKLSRPSIFNRFATSSNCMLSVRFAIGVYSIMRVKLVSTRISSLSPMATLAISGEPVDLANDSMAYVALILVETFRFQKSMYPKKSLYSWNCRCWSGKFTMNWLPSSGFAIG